MTVLHELISLLPHVAKPIQYIGREVNAIQKPWAEVRVKIGLCFPDIYEVGMSHLGLHLLYHIANTDPEVAAERIYAPWTDMESLIRVRQIPLFSLESHRPASDFDILGFTLQYELSYSNLVNMLALAGIPLMAKERTEQYPLIIAGGPCSYNPEPLADFVDVFVIGDGETALPQLIDLYKTWKEAQAGKQDLLKALCRLPGVYVPAFYTVQADQRGRIQAIAPTIPEAPAAIQRAIEPDLNTTTYFQAPILPYLKTVHDRLTLEIMRGCPRGCRFCQAGFIYRPKRERSQASLVGLVQSLLHQSGYEEISLSSLSTGDYSRIAPLMAAAMQICEAERVSLSLPSMRVSTLTEEMAAIIRRVRKTGFTIAPEAGTQRLRNVINKGITDEDILQTAEEAFTSSWDLLKLYFMFGLPTETDDDLEGIITLVARLRTLGNRIIKKKVNLNVAISAFVPKAHTPFQWEAMMPMAELQRRQEILKARIRQRTIQLKWHDIRASYLEGIFARGDRRLGQVLLKAHRLGCKFDGWKEHFDFAKWVQAFQSAEIDPDWYVYRERDEHETFPWDHVQTGVAKTYLWNERLKGGREESTPPCEAHCRRCGLCNQEIRVLESDGNGSQAETFQQISSLPLRDDAFQRPKLYRLRVRYAKADLLRFLSHRELVRVFQRAIARIKAPIAYSQGFHPLPQMAFGPALPVGAEGLNEYVDFFFSEQIEPETFLNQMNATLPANVQVKEACTLDLREASLSSCLHQFGFRVDIPQLLVEQGYTLSYFTAKLHAFELQDAYIVAGFKKYTEAVDIKPFISLLEVSTGEALLPSLQMLLSMHSNVMMKPEEVLHLVFDIPEEKILDCRVVRVFMGTEADKMGFAAG